MKTRNKIIITILTIAIIILLIATSGILMFKYADGEFYISEKNIDIPIFVYHDIVNEVTGPEYMQTSKENFIKQIEGLKEWGYDIIRYDDLIAYSKGEKKLKEKSVIFSFDDGIVGNYNVLFPIIKQYNIPVTINVIDANVGTDGALDWEQIKELSLSGLVDIYSHSRYHEDANTVETKKYLEDVKYSHKHIEEQLGKEVTKVFTYPYGLNNDEKIIALKEAGFVQNLTDNKINKSEKLDLSKLHREYPLNDSIEKILLKTLYRSIRY